MSRGEQRGTGHTAARGRTALTALVLLVLAAVVGACGGGTSDDGGGGGSGGGANEDVTLEMRAITDNQAAWEELIASYKTVAPNVTINASFAPTDQLQTALRAQLGAGGGPDLHVVWPGNGSAMAVAQLAPTGLLADLTDQKWVGTVPEGTRPLLGVEGKTYMWSPSITPIGAIYNKKVFKRAGVEIPTTWDEFLAAGDKLKAAGVIPVALGLQTPWITQLIPYAIAPSTAFAEDPQLAENMLAGEKSFTDSGWGDVFERYLEMNERGLFNPNPNGTTFEQQTELVASGKAAMAIQVTGTLPGYLDAAKNPDDIGTFPFPAAESADDLKIPAGISAGIGISAKTPNMEAAKAFVEWLGEPEQMGTFAKGGYAVPLVSAGGELDPLVQPFAPFVEESKSVPFMDQQWPNAKVQPVHFAGIQELFAGEKTVPQLLSDLDEAYQQK
jgi:raffinose/stachyose/melibiose transport system substrate-binding protein